MTIYRIQNQWGDNNTPWYDGGLLNIGNRGVVKPIAFYIHSGNGGLTLTGTIQYQNEGPLRLRGTLVTTNCYQVEHQWGDCDAPWQPAGLFLLGARAHQNVVAIDLESTDDGQTISGTMTYAGEGEIRVRGEWVNGTAYDTTNQWRSRALPRYNGGQWIMGCKTCSPLTVLDLTSPDQGETLVGTLTYATGGPFNVRCTRIMTDTYSVMNQSGGASTPWHPCGIWVLGCRGSQNIVALRISGDANCLTGMVTYDGEAPLDIMLTPSMVQLVVDDSISTPLYGLPDTQTETGTAAIGNPG